MNDYEQPIMSALLVYRSAHLTCSCNLSCMFCECSDFCNKLHEAYIEALKILPEEVIAIERLRSNDNDQ